MSYKKRNLQPLLSCMNVFGKVIKNSPLLVPHEKNCALCFFFKQLSQKSNYSGFSVILEKLQNIEKNYKDGLCELKRSIKWLLKYKNRSINKQVTA